MWAFVFLHIWRSHRMQGRNNQCSFPSEFLENWLLLGTGWGRSGSNLFYRLVRNSPVPRYSTGAGVIWKLFYFRIFPWFQRVTATASMPPSLPHSHIHAVPIKAARISSTAVFSVAKLGSATSELLATETLKSIESLYFFPLAIFAVCFCETSP